MLQKLCTDAIINEGFEKVPGWECLFMHKSQQLFLSVYVDDFKMAGKKENLAPMWTALRKRLELDPETPMNNSVYLGCGQRNVQVPPSIQQEKSRFFQEILGNSRDENEDSTMQQKRKKSS